jgi:hypothetical protein
MLEMLKLFVLEFVDTMMAVASAKSVCRSSTRPV